jgi:hypothetical protein
LLAREYQVYIEEEGIIWHQLQFCSCFCLFVFAQWKYLWHKPKQITRFFFPFLCPFLPSPSPFSNEIPNRIWGIIQNRYVMVVERE